MEVSRWMIWKSLTESTVLEHLGKTISVYIALKNSSLFSWCGGWWQIKWTETSRLINWKSFAESLSLKFPDKTIAYDQRPSQKYYNFVIALIQTQKNISHCENIFIFFDVNFKLICRSIVSNKEMQNNSHNQSKFLQNAGWWIRAAIKRSNLAK